MAGAFCLNSICVCTDGISILKNGSCVPSVGRVGGPCPKTLCLGPNIRCDSDSHVCVCQPGYTTDPRNLTCALDALLNLQVIQNIPLLKQQAGDAPAPADSRAAVDGWKQLPVACPSNVLSD
ncbi:hypothetical protein ACOMHN_037314 [Nucella lapillus]